jgi:hypothetical protein
MWRVSPVRFSGAVAERVLQALAADKRCAREDSNLRPAD